MPGGFLQSACGDPAGGDAASSAGTQGGSVDSCARLAVAPSSLATQLGGRPVQAPCKEAGAPSRHDHEAGTSARGSPPWAAEVPFADAFPAPGPTQGYRGRRPDRLGGPKQRLVLAHLLLNVNQTVPADHLIDAVWGEETPETARGTLQTYVSRLRSVLGPEADRGHGARLLLRADPSELDAFRFERCFGEARRATGSDRSAAPTRSTRRSALARSGARGPRVEPSLARARSRGWRSSACGASRSGSRRELDLGPARAR